MGKSIQVYYEEKPCYRIEIQNDFQELPGLLEELGFCRDRRLCIVTDSNIKQLYGEALQKSLEGQFSFCGIFSFSAGEASKNTDTVGKVYEYLIAHSFDRKDVLLALGGGVVGDLTGFAASTYLRGIDFIQVPTSLLAQVDSSIGGKTGVDFMQYKNMVGAFYMPKLVYMNLNTLNSLPRIQFASGMGEILKHGQIKDKEYFDFVRENFDKILSNDLGTLEEMVFQSCLIKRTVVQNDPKETGERALLNFGHTIGHAVEKLSDFTLTHGECVALGMVSAGYLSKELGNLSETQLQELEQTLKAFGLPVRLNMFSHTPEEILAVTKLDKKMESGKVKFILLRKPGEAYITKDLDDTQLLSGIRYLFS